MTDGAAAITQRHDQVLAAALRAAYSWSVRDQQPKAAMLEISAMTGIVMEAYGPGRGPVTPLDLVACLRRPLGELLSFAPQDDDVINNVTLLDGNQLAPEAHDLACEYVQPLAEVIETGAWLPKWTRMRGDQIRRQVFLDLVETGKQSEYVWSRKFLIENPAGQRSELSHRLADSGVVLAGHYDPVAAGQVYLPDAGTGWWWPCSHCRWPMSVSHAKVRCRYRLHAPVYEVIAGKKPRLRRVDVKRQVAVPKAEPAAGAVCVQTEIWRHVVVTGSTELRIAQELAKLGAKVDLWPGLDTYDLEVVAGTLSKSFDVKEYLSPHRLIADLRKKPPSAQVLLPKTHEYQQQMIEDALPAIKVTTENLVRLDVRRALKAMR